MKSSARSLLCIWLAWTAACQRPEGAETEQAGSVGAAPAPAPPIVLPQQQAARPDTASVAFSFNEFTTSDAARAAVARVIVEGVPTERWDTLAVAESLQTRDGVIVRRYGYDRAQFPQTVAVLVAAIDTANRSGDRANWAGLTLRVPRFPTRTTRPGFNLVVSRAYDVSKGTYGVLNDPDSRWNKYVNARTDSIAPTPADSSFTRYASKSVVIVPIGTAFVARARAIIATTAASELDVQDAGGIVPLELYRTPPQGACDAASRWLAKSPFRSTVLQRIQAMTPAQRTELAARAKANPLVLVDWDFKLRHGKEVRGVVRATLEALGLLELLDPMVRMVDLDPTPANRPALDTLLDAYRLHLINERMWYNREAAWDAAKTWLAAPTGFGQAYSHEQLINAVFWRYIVSGTHFANFSFGVLSPALNLRPHKIDRSASYAFFAAGNNNVEARGDVALQSLEEQAKAIVTVTAADADGRIMGTYSAPVGSGVRVALAAPACGFIADGITADQKGSSYSSPFVATIAWVSSLLDPAETSTLRDRLMLSVLAEPRPNKQLRADGLFDPWVLLAWPKSDPSAALPNGTIARLDSVRLAITFAPEGKPAITTAIESRARPGSPGMVAFFNKDGATWIWWRDAAGSSVATARLVSASGQVSLNGARNPITNVTGLKALVSAFWY